MDVDDHFIISVYLQNPNDPTILSEWRRVAFIEDFYDILTEVHCREKGHMGIKKTLAEVIYFQAMHLKFQIHGQILTLHLS